MSATTTGGGVRIRPARPDDVPALRELIPLSVRALSAGHYTARQIESALAHVFGVDSQLITDGTYFVAEADGRLVGCGGWSRRRTLFGGDHTKTSGADALLDPAAEPARIRAFFVHPEWARRGIGRRLLHVCEAEARRAGFTRMELGATLPGEPLYAALGFVVAERLEVALADGLTFTVVRMTKDLEGAENSPRAGA